MKTIFVVTKKELDWQVDRHLEEGIKTSHHSSKTKALASIANRLTGINQFAIVVPESEKPIE